MEESTKKWQWQDCPYVNPDVYQLSQIISSKPTTESLEKLHTYLKDDDNLLRRNDARSLFLYYVAKCNTCKALKNEFMKKITNDRTDFELFTTIIIESIKDILFDFEIEKTLLSSRNVVFLLPVVNVFFQLCAERNEEKIDEIAEAIVPLYDIIVETFVHELEYKNFETHGSPLSKFLYKIQNLIQSQLDHFMSPIADSQKHGNNVRTKEDPLLPKFLLLTTFLDLRLDFDEAYTFQNEELIVLSNHALKQVLWIFVKRPEYSIEEYTLSFMDYSYKILSYEKIGMGMKSKCGLIFIHCLGRMPDEELENFNFKEHPMLEVLNQPENVEDWICGQSFKYANIITSNSAKVSLYSALYNCIPTDDLLNIQIKNQSLFRYLFNEMLYCADRPISDNAEIIEVSRNLLLMTNTLNKLPAELLDGIFERSISYINVFSEYHMDAVQKNVSLFLGQLVKLASDHYRNANERFMKYFLKCVNLREGKRKIDFLRIVYICSYMKCSYLLENVPYLREQLTLLLEDPVCHEQAFGAYELLMKEHCKEISSEEWLDLWVKPALGQLRRVRLDRIPVYQELISRAVEINPEIMKDLFPNKYMGSHREWAILLRSLSHARNLKMYTLGSYDSSISWWGLIDKAKLKMFYVQRDDSIRIAALKVIVECQKTTEFFTEWEFTYLVDFYLLNGCNQIPSVRKQITALYKKAFTRYFASLDVIKKKIECFKKKQSPKSSSGENWADKFTKLQDNYKSFLGRFSKFLIGNIAPDGNFYRRTMALDLLMFLQPFVNKNDWNKMWNSDSIDNLKQVLLDSYEINKKMAIAILSKFEPKRFKFDDSDYYTSYFSEALTLASDIKPSKSLSAAYMFQLCTYSPQLCPNAKDVENCREDNEMVLNIIIVLASELLSKFNAETQDVDEAAMNSPCYGVLLCLRYLIRYRMKRTWNAIYASTFSLIYTICTRIFSMVLPIVSNPAPEGYLPENEETEIQIRDDTVRSQRILVYAWRTIKEVTLLFSEFACQDMEIREHRVLDPDDYFAIGEHFMEIFIQAKHRGVFEQAYVGFCLLCECYWKCSNEDHRSLPEKWLRRGLDLVVGKEVDERLCPTRRSAGMPFLILAILTTDPSHDKNSFHLTVAELSKVAASEDETKIEYKTHALNILRFIFRHTKLGDSISPYIERTAELALRGMQSFDWGIRNSSTLLFSALVTRLFGVQRTQDSEEVSVKNKMTVKVFCSKYPKLFDFLLDTLKAECLNNNSLILHPVLLVFSRLYPSHLDPTDIKIEEAIPCIRRCLSNPSVETRKLAARASMALVLVKDLNRSIVRNFAKIAKKRVGNNECHGLLCEIWFILKYSGGKMELPVSQMIASSIYVLEEAGSRFSHHCVSLYMDILSCLFGKYENRVDLDTLRKILTSISRLMEEQNLNVTGRQNFEAAMVNLTITILLMRLEHVETTFQAINYDFENYMMVNEGLIMKTYCLHFVLFVNITYNEYDLQDPPLMILDELKIPESVRDVINNFSKPTQCEFLMYIHKFIVTYLKGEMQRTEPVITNECFVLNLLILPYYPCVLSSLNDGDKQKTLDMLINFCTCDREEVISAVITCISVLLAQLDTDALRMLDYRRLIRLLRKSAAPDAAVHRRLSVCQFMLKCKYLFYCGPKFMGVNSLMHFFCIVITLLEDEALKIRNEMSGMTDEHNIVPIDEESKCGWKCTPDKSRYDFLKHCCKVLPKQFGVALLFGWTIRHFPDTSNDASDVFERSQMNSYAENIPYLHMAAKMLHITLWSIPFDLSYDDKSIFIEEQCQIATTILLDALHGFSFPMVERKTKVSVICALKSILTYLDLNHVNANFKTKFTEYFQKKILLYFRRQICQKDFPSVKRVFLHLYNPVLLESEFK